MHHPLAVATSGTAEVVVTDAGAGGEVLRVFWEL